MALAPHNLLRPSPHSCAGQSFGGVPEHKFMWVTLTSDISPKIQMIHTKCSFAKHFDEKQGHSDRSCSTRHVTALCVRTAAKTIKLHFPNTNQKVKKRAEHAVALPTDGAPRARDRRAAGLRRRFHDDRGLRGPPWRLPRAAGTPARRLHRTLSTPSGQSYSNNSAQLTSLFPCLQFSCDDGARALEIARLNDNYCDCADGADEPGTSACSHTRAAFHCANAGYFPADIPTSRVNDGLCGTYGIIVRFDTLVCFDLSIPIEYLILVTCVYMWNRLL